MISISTQQLHQYFETETDTWAVDITLWYIGEQQYWSMTSSTHKSSSSLSMKIILLKTMNWKYQVLRCHERRLLFWEQGHFPGVQKNFSKQAFVWIVEKDRKVGVLSSFGFHLKWASSCNLYPPLFSATITLISYSTNH